MSIFISISINAQVFIENFSTALSNGNLEGYNNWYVSFKSTDALGVSPKIANEALFYNGYIGSNIGKVAILDSVIGITTANQRISTRAIVFDNGDTLKPVEGKKIYAAFIVNVSQKSSRTYRDFFTFEGSSTNSSTRGRVFTKVSNTGDLYFAVSKNSSTTGVYIESPVILGGVGNNHLLVLCYEGIYGVDNDKITLYIDPDLTKTEAAQTNLLNATDIQKDYSDIVPFRINLRQRGIGAKIGGIRVGNSWNDVLGIVPTSPQLTTSAALTGLNYNYGSGPSAEQTFTVSGSSLSGNVVITPSSRLEISKTTGTGFASTAINLTPITGSVSNTTIYVRLKSGLISGIYSDSIVITSSNVIPQKIICKDSVFNTTQTQNLLTNPSFETWSAGVPTGWTLSPPMGTITQSPISASGQTGSSFQYLNIGPTTFILQQNVLPPDGASTFDTSKTYKLSVTYLVTSGDGTDARVWSGLLTSAVGTANVFYPITTHADSILYYIPFHGPGGNIFPPSGTFGNDNNGYLLDNRTSGVWHTYTYSFKFPAGIKQFNFAVRSYMMSTVIWDDFYFGEVDNNINYPDLHVTSVTASNSISGTKTTVEWTVKNDGSRSTQKNTWRDKIWLVPDITKNFSSTGYLLSDVQNKDSLVLGNSYNNSTQVTIPERLQGTYYLVVTSDMSNIAAIDWHLAGDTVPNIYTPNITGIPYPHLQAHSGLTSNSVYEIGEINDISDNFNYKIIQITLPDLPELQITSIDVPATIIAERKATISATITNKGNVDVAVGKSFVNRLYWTKDATFNKNTATLLASKTLSGGLIKDASQSIQFAFTAPMDSVNQIRFFVEADALDSIFELDQTNNFSNSNWLNLKANTIESADYAVLKNFYASAGGSAWTTKWNTASNVINSTNWYGVSFNEGYVTSIALPSNNITATFPVGLGSLDSLTTLQLAGNKLFGEIPALTNQFRALKNMNLSYNKFTSMAGAIPASVSSLNVSYQQFLVDSLHLSVSPTFSLPQILNYNHSSQAFSTKPTFVIYDGINPVGNLGYNASNELEMSWYSANGWPYKSGKIFTLTQNNGSTYGSNAALKIYYNYGDANVDKQISILDVQHTLNFMLGEPATPFNFSAADTYCDTLITVQDIVSTINILLNEVAPVGPPENILRKIKASDFSPATVYIADNKLILKTTVPVAAFDVTLSGLTETQLQHQLADYGFSVITRKQKDGSIRFVAFSASGSEIPVGNTCIADVNSENVQVKQVVLSNKQAQAIAIEVSEETNTGIDVNGAYTMAISSNQAKVNLKIPSGFETVDVVVYNPQGVEIAQRKLITPMVGSYQFDFGTDIRMQGVYFIKVVAKSNKITSTINSKIIVSK